MGGHGPADVGAIGHALDQDLDGAARHAHGVVQGEMPLEEGLDASRQGGDEPLGPGAIRSDLAVDREAVTRQSILSLVSFASSETLRPVSQSVQMPSFSWCDRQALASRVASSWIRGWRLD